jgi:hypothetical protein
MKSTSRALPPSKRNTQRQLARTVTAQKPLRFPLSGCSFEERMVHALDGLRRFERGQDQPDTGRHLGRQFAAVAALIVLPQPLMPDRFDHERSEFAATVKRRLTYVNRYFTAAECAADSPPDDLAPGTLNSILKQAGLKEQR